MRRRSKPRVVWIPPTAENSVDAAGRSCWGVATLSGLDSQTPGFTSTIEIPILLDGSASQPLAADSTLADIEGSGYRLRRIVGKLYVFCGQTNVLQSNLWGVTAGFIIRRVDNDGTSLANGVGSPSDILISTADIDNSMDPWIWRRSWMLQDGPTHLGDATPVTQDVLSEQVHRGPGQNFGTYTGGNIEGPTVDQKTARIVGPEERLFLDVTATSMFGTGDVATTSIVCLYEFRALGSMRTNIGNRRNASR